MSSSSQELEITFERILHVWWAFMWRAVVFGMLAGAFLGFIGGVIVGLAGQPQLGGAVGALLGWFVGIPISFIVLGIALRKRYAAFSIKFFAHEPG